MNILQKFFGHLHTVLKHKWVVFKLCVKIGQPIRGLLHDLSKFSWTEFSEGVKYYIGTHSPITECKKDIGYSEAWLHHKGRNKHHVEYWYDEIAPNPTPIIPYKYVAEMLCDKMAAGIVYQGKNWTKEYELNYWLKEREKAKLNPKIKELITECFTQVSQKGIDEVYTKKNFRKLYKKYCEQTLTN